MKTFLNCILPAVLFLTGCGEARWLKEFELSEANFDSEAMLMVEKDTGLNLPAGSRGLNFYYSPPIDPAFVAKIQIPKDSSDSLMKQIETLQNEEMILSGGPGKKVKWWPPPKGSVLIDRQCTQSDGGYLRAAMTEENGQVILYVEHMED